MSEEFEMVKTGKPMLLSADGSCITVSDDGDGLCITGPAWAAVVVSFAVLDELRSATAQWREIVSEMEKEARC